MREHLRRGVKDNTARCSSTPSSISGGIFRRPSTNSPNNPNYRRGGFKMCGRIAHTHTRDAESCVTLRGYPFNFLVQETRSSFVHPLNISGQLPVFDDASKHFSPDVDEQLFQQKRKYKQLTEKENVFRQPVWHPKHNFPMFRFFTHMPRSWPVFSQYCITASDRIVLKACLIEF